jgi:hypothetical protein
MISQPNGGTLPRRLTSVARLKMLRRIVILSLLATASAARADTSEFDIRGLRAGMPFAAVPKSLQCRRIGTSPVAECLPEAGATIRVELTSPAAGERIANVTYYFYSREPLGRESKVGATLIAKFGEPTETLDGWLWRRGNVSVSASVPGDMQQAVLRLEDPDFLKKAEQAAEKPADAKSTKPARMPKR